jgi:hypothetical protein
MTDMIGHNNPPAFEAHKADINDLYNEAKNWLDGEKVETESVATKISDLMNLARKAKSAAEKSRTEEKKPFLDAGKEIDGKYKEITTKADTAIDVCKKALQPYLEEQEHIRQEEIARAKREAEEAERLAQEAFANAKADNLEDRESAYEASDAAIKAKAVAKKIENTKANSSSQFGRAISLRTTRIAVVTNLQKAAEYYWSTDRGRQAFLECVERLARQDMKEVPGIEIHERQSVA